MPYVADEDATEMVEAYGQSIHNRFQLFLPLYLACDADCLMLSLSSLYRLSSQIHYNRFVGRRSR
jgi:hypothetical protein